MKLELKYYYITQCFISNNLFHLFIEKNNNSIFVFNHILLQTPFVTVFNAKINNSKGQNSCKHLRQRIYHPFRTYNELNEETIDKCYKFHDYPYSYIFKLRINFILVKQTCLCWLNSQQLEKVKFPCRILMWISVNNQWLCYSNI